MIRTNCFRFWKFSFVLVLCLLFSLSWSINPVNAAKRDESPVMLHILGPSIPPGFSPSLVTVHVNQQVIFFNEPTSSASYSLAANDNSFTSPNIAPGQQWAVTFDQPGTHQYSAVPASQQMVGLIIVVPTSVQFIPTPDAQKEAATLAAIKAKELSHPPSSNTSIVLIALTSGILVVLLIAFLTIYRIRSPRKI